MNTRPTTAETVRFSPDDLARVAQDNPKASLVEQIFALVVQHTQARRSAVGTRLPSVRQFSDDCSVSRDTVARAYERLVSHGVVDARRGSGYYVKTPVRRSPVPSNRAPIAGPARDIYTRWRTLIVRPDPALVSRTGSGSFPESWQDEASLTNAVRAVSRQSTRALAHYGDARGYLPLRQQLQIKLQEVGIITESGHLMTTSGAMDALSLVCQAFFRPTDAVIIESPCAPLLIDRLLSSGLEIYTVPRLQDGPDLNALRIVCEARRPKAFFCSTVLHNPTCTQMAAHKAFQLLQLASEFDFMLVEDDSYSDLYPSTASVSRLATLDQLKRVIYVGGFSKTVAPGLRCGFVAASPERIDWMSTYRAVQSISGSTLSERVLYKVLADGGYRRHCEHLRTRLAEVRPRVVAELERKGLSVEIEPEHGMFLWAKVANDIDMVKVAERMLELGHLIAPGRIFGNVKVLEHYLRINLAEESESPMLPTLGKLLGHRG